MRWSPGQRSEEVRGSNINERKKKTAENFFLVLTSLSFYRVTCNNSEGMLDFNHFMKFVNLYIFLFTDVTQRLDCMFRQQWWQMLRLHCRLRWMLFAVLLRERRLFKASKEVEKVQHRLGSVGCKEFANWDRRACPSILFLHLTRMQRGTRQSANPEMSNQCQEK